MNKKVTNTIFLTVLVGLIILIIALIQLPSEDNSNKSSYSISSSQQEKLTNKLKPYMQKEDASFNKAKVTKDKIIIYFDDDDVEAPVTDNGLKSVLETSYQDAQKYQKQCGTKLPYEFKDKSSGTIAKCSNGGNGWFKELSNGVNNEKTKLNFKSGETE